MNQKLFSLGLAGILTLSSTNCAFFHRTKIDEQTEVIKQEPVQEPVTEKKLEEQVEEQQTSTQIEEQTNPPKIEEITPEDQSQELTYKEQIKLVRDYLLNNQEGDRNIHTYDFSDQKIFISLPVKKELKGRNDLLYLEVVQNNKGFLYVHLPENEYPDAVIEGTPGILEYLFNVYDKGGNLEASIWWNYTIHQPPSQEQLKTYEIIISELEKEISK
ncbi:hypothetical protein HZA97_03155 [Candidatus Woesearchaeota archaeon]|nr:hypothetical protein [Candidatus Woesearchaeota archaeon]